MFKTTFQQVGWLFRVMVVYVPLLLTSFETPVVSVRFLCLVVLYLCCCAASSLLLSIAVVTVIILCVVVG